MDYTRIRGMESGQRLAFEELICQLARRERPAADAEFRRIEGAGGDGGIEAYWLLDDGSEIGYQAKYYTKSREINWANIDDSVETALKAHPELTKYVIALPCDLTDKTGKQGRGNTGWQSWNARKAKWTELVAPGKSIEFIVWTASDITDRLAHPSAEGLRRFWFGDFEFSARWFSDHIALAIKSLDERYHPEDHVEVGIERVFRIALRDPSIITEIQEQIAKIYAAAQLKSVGKTLSGQVDQIEKIEQEIGSLESLSQQFTTDAWRNWPLREVIQSVENISDNVHDLELAVWKLRESMPEQPKSGFSALDSADHTLRKLSDVAYTFRSYIQKRHFSAEYQRSILIYGKAGTGKSHLLGSIAESAITEGRPVFLILGQHLTAENIWTQISRRLGIDKINPDALLQALSAAADASGKRGLILVDAVNEGAGLALWRNELAEFIARVERHANLLLVFSCRTEYKPYVIPKSLEETIPSFRIQGFETKEEQSRAARVYLGGRGISQPNTPWLAAEFVNPLFLRSACVALKLEGLKHFPKGLVGTKQVFSFYTKSIARNMGVGRDGSDELVIPTNQALAAIAAYMATHRRDFVPHIDAIRIVGEKFHAYPTPPGITWFEALQRNGLFRLDPNPRGWDADPFAVPDDIVRFSFQRLQDYLMASGLLKEVDDPSEALRAGTLQFIHDGESIHGEWAGLTDALSVQLPELFDQELLDLLPGDIGVWADDYAVGNAFIESLRWRNNDSFTERTLEIFEAFVKAEEEHFDIVVQVSANVGHPWNAKVLHKKLINLSMANRDAHWTVLINELPLGEGDTARRLIEWSAFEQNERTDPEVQHLCAITLTWFLASSNRELRDKSTKALTSLMIHNLSLYAKLSQAFYEVDDLYVLERLHTAAYGACCIRHDEKILREFAGVAYETVFNREDVTASILLRDAAFGIIELAHARGHLPSTVDMLQSRPPYTSKAIRLAVTEEALEKAANRAGDSQIQDSCSQWGGDFGCYEIRPRVSSFANVSLSKAEPLTPTERYEVFEQEVIDHCPIRVELLELMRTFAPNRFRDLAMRRKGKAAKDYSEHFRDCEKLLLMRLSTKEKARYRKEYKPRFNNEDGRPDPVPHIDIAAAQLWVAKRAYALGWTKKLFPNDRSRRHDYSRDRPLVERIGKKYQWLALDELLCSLADNKWMSERALHGSRQYAGPLDIGFHRDIDPTILLPAELLTKPEDSIARCEISMRETSEAELGKWPFEENPATNMPNLLVRKDLAGQDWVVLHEHRSETERYKDKSDREHGQRKQEWRFLLPVIVRHEDQEALIKYIRLQKEIRVDNWSTRNSTDNGYLLEAPWRSTWDQEQWSIMDFYNIGEVEVAYPCFRYHWESHLDASLTDGAHALIPAPWLAKRLGLRPDHANPNIYVGASGTPLFVSGQSRDDGSHAFIDQDLFNTFLEEDGLSCIWVFVTERGAWPDGGNHHASWRRSEGIVWHSKGKPQIHHWKRDTDKSETEEPLDFES
ncbi:AAA family ATPase [Pseudomonas parafulva]|uniref:AAA family ATPase n=1 Tax=Pseudomonas parafulva TaxID=157782 RepID=A0ABM6J7C6_9PSED|nr:AAA family ATPase [Pseudomonas parafulva]AQW70395.1 AAA family ATPase [Pseudomonas parafulva]WHU42087.1 ATP-binding protein [Pseudomonas fulva]